MWRDIVLRELLDHLLSLRVALTAAITLGLMAVSAVLFVADQRERQADYQSFVEENQEALRQAAAKPRAALYYLFSFADQRIYRAPNPMSFLAEGGSKDLPNALSVDAFVLHSPRNLSRGNPLLWRFRMLDWSFIVAVVLSFAAVVLSYDGVSGEREAQTLRLAMAQAVHRHALILGKLSGILLCLLLLLLAGMLLHLAIVVLAGTMPLGLPLLVAGAGAFLLSGLYLAVFVLLGLLVSSRCRESATSLVISLVVWVLLVMAVPNLGGLLASSTVELPNAEEMDEQASKAYDEAFTRYNEQHPDPHADWYSGHWSPGEPLKRAILMDEAKERIRLDYLVRMLAQARAGRALTRCSPTATYRYAMEALAGSGLEHFARFLEEARHYRAALKNFLVRKYPANPEHPYSDQVAQQAISVKVDFAEVPQFQDRLATPLQAGSEALFSGGLLFLWVAVAFSAAYFSFLRCDVR